MSVVCFHFIAMWDVLIIHATDAVDSLYSGRTNVTLTLSPPLRMSRICVRKEARSASAVCGVFLVGVEVEVDVLGSESSASSAITPGVR